MKIPWLCIFALLCATPVAAQNPEAAQPPATGTTPTISMTGCVAGGSSSTPITLTNAMVLPTGSAAVPAEPAAPASDSALPTPPAASGSATQPATPPNPTGATSSVGTVDAGSATAAVGTAGSIAGTAPAGSSASSIDGYRLSGADMTSWIGRRVQLTGLVVPPARTRPPVANPSEPLGVAAMPEFRVMSVMPVTGPCPK